MEESSSLLHQLLSQTEPMLAGDGCLVPATEDLEPLLQRLKTAADTPCHLVWAERDSDTDRVR